MDIKNIKQLAIIMQEHDLSQIEISEKESKIVLKKQVTEQVLQQLAVPVASVAGVPVPAEKAPEKSGEALASPLVGVAYAAATPGSKPFVRTGSRVDKGQTLCIIEAMKVMNEFTAPRSGEILEICFEDAQMVEFGQCLFRIQ